MSNSHSNDIPSESDIFQIIRKFVSDKGLVSHQIDSYNYLLEYHIQKIFDDIPILHMNPKPHIDLYIKFGQVYIDYPSVPDENSDKKENRLLYPSEARLRDLTYESSVYVDIYEKVVDSEKGGDSHYPEGVIRPKGEECHTQHNRVWMADIPQMIGSCKCTLYRGLNSNNIISNTDKIEAGECEKDIGGYFILKGKEKVLVGQERINYNQIYIFKQKTKQHKWAHIAEIRSISEETAHSVLVQGKCSEDGRVMGFSLPYIKIDIPAGIIFRALGFTGYHQILKLLGGDNRLSRFVQWIVRYSEQIEEERIDTQEKALEYIGSYPIQNTIDVNNKIEYATQVLENEVFPHLSPSTPLEVALCLGSMVSKLLYTVLGLRTYDDRDNISLKRLETAGILVGDLFRMNLKKTIEICKRNITKKPDFISALGQNTITNNIRYCFSTGNWGVQKNTYKRNGVSQGLSRLTYAATLSHLRRLIIPNAKDSKNTKIRQLHPTQAFFICPCESPDGSGTIGIVKNLAFSARITQPVNTVALRQVVESQEYIIPMTTDPPANSAPLAATLTKILINGRIVGYTLNPSECLIRLRKLRQFGIIGGDVSISIDKVENQCNIFSDEGRFSRPVFTVEGGKLKLTSDPEWKKLSWVELVARGYIQYVDSYEVENCVIAMTPAELEKYGGRWDYCEIHPSLMLGVAAIVIPYSDHNQSPRNCYQTGMIKQAIGIYSLAYQNRTDTTAYVLDYPQKPLISSPYGEMLEYDDMPYGINAIVAIACYTGYNQEDSVIINKSSIERGLFSTHAYKTLVIEEKKINSSNFETIELPPQEIRNRSLCYTKLDSTGIIRKGSIIVTNDVIVAKTTTEIGKEDSVEDVSVSVKDGEEGIVDEIYITHNGDGNKTVKLRIRNIKIPEVGDKFSSRYAQKGVCGMIFPQEDLPFTAEGIVPDIIINSHCIPSRMTVGQLIECVLGKKCCMEGTFGDSTPFTEASRDPVESISLGLKNHGFHRYGNEVMYSGFTGEPLDTMIFIGPTYYQRLKHMVSDKMHCRATGNVTAIFRQPQEGRSRNGGLKLGEMEKDALLSHGTSSFLRERMFNMSDPYTVNICKICKNFASGGNNCLRCNDSDEICRIDLPYACKVLIHQLMAMNIKIDIVTK